MGRPRYDKGDWKAVCDSCGFEFKASKLRKRWDGLMVCSKDWEPRQPQDFVKGVADIQTPPWTRPEAADTFIGILFTQTFSDGITLSEVSLISKTFDSTLSDTQSITDSTSNSAGKLPAETQTIDETTVFILNPGYPTNPVNLYAINEHFIG